MDSLIFVSDDSARYSEDHFQQAIELNPQMLWTASADGVVDAANLRWRSLVGVPAGEPVAGEWARAVHPDDLPATLAVWSVCLRTGAHLDHEYRLRLADGHYRWFRARAVPRIAANGDIIRWYGSLEDVHDAKLGVIALRESERRLRFALEVGRLGAWELDLRTCRLTASDICARCFGYATGDQLADYETAILAAVHPEDRARYHDAIAASLATNQEFVLDYRTIWPDGSTRWIHLSGRPLADEPGASARMVGLAVDVTEQRRDAEERLQAEARAKYIAHHDALTGLANRRLFDDQLELALARATPDSRVALLSIDLDRFKAVNDTLGHAAGDKVLRLAADRLRHCVRPDDLVARYGGDEFVILYDGFTSRIDVQTTAQRILDALSAPFDLDGTAAELGGSIGISVAPDDTQEAAELWRNADAALYRSKRGGRGRHQFFEAETDARPTSRHLLNLGLRDALARQELSLAFQPMVHLATGRTAAFEALLRWQSHEHGAVGPAEFIPVAEKTGWIVPIGRWALQEACRQAATWPDETRVAVNLSAVQFSAGGLEEAVSHALIAAGLPAHRLELEVTETLLLHDNQAALGILESLRRLGVRLALDDFGTGYSSLSGLRKFRFDMIKIDEALVSRLPGTDGEDSTVRAIADLGRSLGIAITAEGVETRAQLEMITAQGCTQAQGRFFSPPRAEPELGKAWN